MVIAHELGMNYKTVASVINLHTKSSRIYKLKFQIKLQKYIGRIKLNMKNSRRKKMLHFEALGYIKELIEEDCSSMLNVTQKCLRKDQQKLLYQQFKGVLKTFSIHLRKCQK